MVLGFYLVGALSYFLPPGMGCYPLFLTTRHGVLPSIRLALNQLFTPRPFWFWVGNPTLMEYLRVNWSADQVLSSTHWVVSTLELA